MAQRIARETTITQPTETIEQVLTLAATGASQRDIAAEVEAVSASTARRIVQAARELADQAEEHHPNDELAGQPAVERVLTRVG